MLAKNTTPFLLKIPWLSLSKSIVIKTYDRGPETPCLFTPAVRGVPAQGIAIRYETAGNDTLHHRSALGSTRRAPTLLLIRDTVRFRNCDEEPWEPDVLTFYLSHIILLIALTPEHGLHRMLLTCNPDWIERIFLLHLIPQRSDLLPNSLERSE